MRCQFAMTHRIRLDSTRLHFCWLELDQCSSKHKCSSLPFQYTELTQTSWKKREFKLITFRETFATDSAIIARDNEADAAMELGESEWFPGMNLRIYFCRFSKQIISPDDRKNVTKKSFCLFTSFSFCVLCKADKLLHPTVTFSSVHPSSPHRFALPREFPSFFFFFNFFSIQIARWYAAFEEKHFFWISCVRERGTERLVE